jgi:hypothetical protein
MNILVGLHSLLLRIKRRRMISHCCLCVIHTPSFFACVFVAMGTCLLDRCLATAVSVGSTVPAFRRHVTLQSKVGGRCVFCAVRFVADTQYVVNGEQAISSRLQQMWLLLRKINSSHRRWGPLFRHVNGIGMNTNLVIDPERAHNQERLCWRRPAAIFSYAARSVLPRASFF